MEAVTGIGGIFFRARDPERLTRWYELNLGVAAPPATYDDPSWRQDAGPTVFAPMPAGSPHFTDPAQQWSINLRVRDLDAMLAQLRRNGVEVREHDETYPNGRFAELTDPEGTPIQLWEPAGVDAAEQGMSERTRTGSTHGSATVAGTPRLAATPEDFAAAARLQVDFNTEYDDPVPPADELAQHLARLTAQGDTRVWLIGDPPLGHAIVRVRTQSMVDELEGYLAEFYVRPDRRAQGIGTVLLQAIIDDLKAQGATYMDLGTSEDDVSARGIYEKFGFDCHEGRGSGPLALYYEKDL